VEWPVKCIKRNVRERITKKRVKKRKLIGWRRNKRNKTLLSIIDTADDVQCL